MKQQERDKAPHGREAPADDRCFLCGRPFREPGERIVVSEDGTLLLFRVCGMYYEHPEGCCE